MVVRQVTGDIFTASQKHIAFAINKEGENYSGFACAVAKLIWPDLMHLGGKLGDVHSHKRGQKTYHALVCHSMIGRKGWKDSPKYVRECLNKIRVPEDEEIAIVLIGSGPVGRSQGANVDAILAAMHKSSKRLVVFML